MNYKNARSAFTRLIVFAIAISVFAGQTVLFAFTLPGGGTIAGEITVSGRSASGEKPFVLVNGDRALSGRTLFSNDTVVTTETTSASVRLGKVGRVDISAGSTVTLSFTDDRIDATLTAGNIFVSNNDGVAVKINTPDDTITNEGALHSQFSVSVADQKSAVVAKAGTVRYNKGASVAQDDDDDDDDDDYWLPIVLVSAAVGAGIILYVVFQEDDEIVSPVR